MDQLYLAIGMDILKWGRLRGPIQWLTILHNTYTVILGFLMVNLSQGFGCLHYQPFLIKNVKGVLLLI